MNSAKEAKEKDSDVRDLWNTQVNFLSFEKLSEFVKFSVFFFVAKFYACVF
jgi:hypothetical protein